MNYIIIMGGDDDDGYDVHNIILYGVPVILNFIFYLTAYTRLRNE